MPLVHRSDWDSEPLRPIEVGFDNDENLSSFLHSQRPEERETEFNSTIARLRSWVSRDPHLGTSFLIPNRHPKLQLATEPVTAILQSERPNDDISSELVELLGFEEVELVMELISNRSKIVEHLAVSLSSWIPLHILTQ
jgi:N-terminal helicase PWI domain